MDFTVISLIVGVVATIIASVIGGLIGGYMAILASRQSAKDAFFYSLQLQERTQVETVKGVILALQAEIKTLLEIYETEFKEEIEALEEDKEFDSFYPVTQNYFILYEQNARYVGLIPDDELRDLIIKTYLRGRTILDTHQFNNEMLAETDRLHVLYAQKPSPELLEQIQLSEKQSREYGINIQINYHELLDLTKKLDERIGIVIPMLNAYDTRKII